jgi:hypothetical protein
VPFDLDDQVERLGLAVVDPYDEIRDVSAPLPGPQVGHFACELLQVFP